MSVVVFLVSFFISFILVEMIVPGVPGVCVFKWQAHGVVGKKERMRAVIIRSAGICSGNK